MIDWERVADLRDEIGADDFAEVVDMFLRKRTRRSRGCARAGPDPTLEAELHFLKGSALNLGFRELAGIVPATARSGAAAGAAGRSGAGRATAMQTPRRAFCDGLAARAA